MQRQIGSLHPVAGRKSGETAAKTHPRRQSRINHLHPVDNLRQLLKFKHESPQIHQVLFYIDRIGYPGTGMSYRQHLRHFLQHAAIQFSGSINPGLLVHHRKSQPGICQRLSFRHLDRIQLGETHHICLSGLQFRTDNTVRHVRLVKISGRKPAGTQMIAGSIVKSHIEILDTAVLYLGDINPVIIFVQEIVLRTGYGHTAKQ